MSSAYDITALVKPPRSVFLDFPLGHTCGKPYDKELQLSIIKEALVWGVAQKEGGKIHKLPYEWDEDDSWKKVYGINASG